MSDTKTVGLSKQNIHSLDIFLLLLFWSISKLAVDVLIHTFQYTDIEVFLSGFCQFLRRRENLTMD